MSEKKRKHPNHESNRHPHKELAKESGVSNVVKILPLPNEGEWAPVLGTLINVCFSKNLNKEPLHSANIRSVANTPGVSFLPELALKPYTKPLKHGTSSIGQSSLSTSEHLLHTSEHGRLDYIAREEEGSGAEGLLKHYIGVYDTSSGNLKLVKVRKMTLRGGLRSEAAEIEEKSENENVSLPSPEGHLDKKRFSDDSFQPRIPLLATI